MTNVLDSLAESRQRFISMFVAGPLLVASVLPTLFFGILLNQWGSNLVWGSVFGFGWCMAAFAAGGLRSMAVGWVGLAWGWLVLIPLYFIASVLWNRLSGRGRRIALAALFASFVIDVPAKTLMALDAWGIHFPDYTLHAAESY
jgi:hypothetical protein